MLNMNKEIGMLQLFHDLQILTISQFAVLKFAEIDASPRHVCQNLCGPFSDSYHLWQV